MNDELAYQFAREFYPRLLDGVPLGEAFRQAREEVRRQNPTNPTWLAYCLYGDPLATISPSKREHPLVSTPLRE